MDIRESTQLTEERKPLKLAEVLESSKKQFIRTMQEDIESLQKGQPAKPSMPKADQIKKAAPPTELPVVEPAGKPVSPPLPSLHLESAEGLKKEAEIEKRIEETQKRLEEERTRAEMARQKAEPVSLKKELPLEKEVKPVIEKSRLKFVFIGLAVILIIGGIGGFLYWWNYLRVIPPVAMHYECQDLQCVSIKGEGTDECLVDEDCQPSYYQCRDSQCIEIEGEGEDQCLTDEDCQPVEPTIPDSLITVDETKTIELTIGQENLLLDELKSVAVHEQAQGTFKRILVKLVNQTERKYADLDTLISALEISLPDNILLTVATSEVEAGNYTLFFYNQTEGNRLGIVIDMAESATLVEDLKTWEETIITDLGSLLLKDEIPTPFTEEFQDNAYQDIAIRYLNFPMPDLSIDYAIVAGKLVITMSRESMYASIDALLIADWQIYRNENFGISFSYPSEWYVGETNTKDVRQISITNYDPAEDAFGGVIGVDYIDIDIYLLDIQERETVDQWADRISFNKTKEIYIDSIKALKEDKKDFGSGHIGGKIILVYNNIGYSISYFPYNSNLINIFNQILSTFKFIE